MLSVADIVEPIALTVRLAVIVTVLLLFIATPIAWWLARSSARWKEAVAAVVSLPLVLPPTVLGFYLLMALAPNGPGGLLAGLWGARTLAFSFEGLVIASVIYALPFGAADAQRVRGLRRGPLEAAATLGASRPGETFVRVAVPLARPRLSHRRGAHLRAHRRRVRRRPDDRRQYPGRDAGALGRAFQLRRARALERGSHHRRGDGGLRFHRHHGDHADRPAARPGARRIRPKRAS